MERRRNFHLPLIVFESERSQRLQCGLAATESLTADSESDDAVDRPYARRDACPRHARVIRFPDSPVSAPTVKGRRVAPRKPTPACVRERQMEAIVISLMLRKPSMFPGNQHPGRKGEQACDSHLRKATAGLLPGRLRIVPLHLGVSGMEAVVPSTTRTLRPHQALSGLRKCSRLI
jgi:hypothetical protein